jgi:prolyl-tRNA synthetase
MKNFNVDTNSLENRYDTLQKLYQGLMLKINLQNKNVKEQSQRIKEL